MSIPDFCKALKEERLRREFTLDDIEDRSNIPAKVLQTLESGSISEIPGRFYLRSFVRSYLHILGVDERSFFLKHNQEISGFTHINDVEKVVSFSKLKYHRFRSKKILYLLTGIILLVLLAGLMFLPAAAPIRDCLGIRETKNRIVLLEIAQKDLSSAMCILRETL